MTTQRSEERPTTVVSRAQLRDVTDGAIRRALRAAARGAFDDELRSALDDACTAARDHGVPVEQLIILLKECWGELPKTQCVVRSEADVTIARVVTMCIRVYYAPFLENLDGVPSRGRS